MIFLQQFFFTETVFQNFENRVELFDGRNLQSDRP